MGALAIPVLLYSYNSLLVPPDLHSSQLLNYAQIGLLVVGFVSAKPSLHVALALAFPGLLLIYLLTLMVEPDSVFHAGS